MNFAQAAIVALGSNLGNSADIVRSAIERLRGFSDHPIVISSLYETHPVDCPPGSPAFTNAVVALKPRPGETPASLLRGLQALEREFGRQRTGVRNEARTLDLDIIAFGRRVESDPTLTLPHPRADQRAFVLAPLAEIAPDYVLPQQKQTVRALLTARDDATPQVRRLESP